MKLTKQDRLNLSRFGCTLQSRKNVLQINWFSENREQISEAKVLARTLFATCTGGPLICLALEVSTTCALPRYCYFPLNLRNKDHKSFLSSTIQNKRLRLTFLVQGDGIKREHYLTNSESAELEKSIARTLESLNGFGGTYRFEVVVQEFESTFRIPQFFERAISEYELNKVVETIHGNAANLPTEKKEMAHRIVRGLADPVREKWGNTLRKQIDELPKLRTAILLLLDLQRTFDHDYDAFLNFISDSVAVNTDEEALKKLITWPTHLESILRLIEQMNASPETGKEVRSEIGDRLNQVLTAIGSGRGLSLSMLQNLLPPLRPLLSVQPGRPPKDYSKEHQWKSAGSSWSKVTRLHFQENEETRSEFGHRDFDDLDLDERQNLQNRIRAGVRSYSERLKNSAQ